MKTTRWDTLINVEYKIHPRFFPMDDDDWKIKKNEMSNSYDIKQYISNL